ncbi:MAG: TonB-dependent receptor plug domain-containing protein [Tenacibaculum sp.]
MKNYNFILFLALAFICLSLNAQIKGKILNNNGDPYPGIKVFLKNKMVVTDNKGLFSIEGKLGDILEIKGYKYKVNSFFVRLAIDKSGNKFTLLDEVMVFSNKTEETLEKIEIKKQTIAKFRGSSNAEIFNGLPGVQINNIRNEAGALDIGIRGLQGNGRVSVLIDGGLQSLQTNRGYQGTSDRTYIDMDLIRKVQVDKGASFNPNTIGAPGGVVQLTTINADDVVLGGNSFGILLKGNITNNNLRPNVFEDETSQNYYILTNSINESRFNGNNGMLAVAYKGSKLHLTAAINTRSQGNFFAGKNGAEQYGYNPEYYDEFNSDFSDNFKNPTVKPKQEVVNTSYSSLSTLFKLKWNIGINHQIEGIYRYHGQKAGEVMSAYWRKNSFDADFNPFEEGVESMPQWGLGSADIYSYSLNYSFNPNKKINLHVSLYANNGDFNQRNGLGQVLGANYGDQYLHKYKNNRKGLIAYNTTVFNFLPLTLSYGLTAQTEKIIPLETIEEILSTVRNGNQELYSAYLLAEIKWKKFLLQAQTKAHTAIVHDNNSDQKKIDYGIKGDIIGRISYRPFEWINLYTKASSINRNPSLYESTESSQIFSYNEKFPITAERTRAFEIGFQTNFNTLLSSDDQLVIGINKFYNSTKNYISPGVTSYFEFIFVNYDEFNLNGTEFSLSYSSPYMFLNSSAVLYQDASACSLYYGSLNNKCTEQGYPWSLLPSRIPPKQSFATDLGLYAFEKKLSLGGRLRYHSKKEYPENLLEGTGASGIISELPISELPSDYTIDVYGWYRLNPNFSVFVNIDNLTDRYQFDLGSVITIPTPGRTMRLGLEVNL